MTTPFGPQLIGETEKTLNALLLRFLDGTDLTEPQWVTLRVAHMLDGAVDANGLASAVSDRAQFPDAQHHVELLTSRGLLVDGSTTSDGEALLRRVQTALAEDVATIFGNLEPCDVAATERVLNELSNRARVALAS